MEKRYQVFVSSTYADLKDERNEIIRTLLNLDCIPAGMEIFPASDDEQWRFIQGVIDDCDYYIIVIGGRYGSLSEDGIGYTEKEFDYAVAKGIPVLAFIHSKPDSISVEKSDIDPVLRAKLDDFREKVCTGRLVKMWEDSSGLAGLVTVSLVDAIKRFPAVGWVRGEGVASEGLLREINELRKENDSLKDEVNQISKSNLPDIEDIAGLDEKFSIRYTYPGRYSVEKGVYECTWGEILSAIGPKLEEYPTDTIMSYALGNYLKGKGRSANLSVNIQDIETIRIQFSALGLISTSYTKTTAGTMGLFWRPTKRGLSKAMELRVVRSTKPDA
ncbi:DUF4062 domain-containing protein [Pyruvatibacter sp. HU-CL02332]|uniref:DUF4062 domain-containing protein n=1 Tax=Pyruvatibacter sp. HU-CL02332 TaxID=3127650 RepID=UPI003365A448